MCMNGVLGSVCVVAGLLGSSGSAFHSCSTRACPRGVPPPLPSPPCPRSHVAVHPSLPYVLTCSDDMTIKLWDWDKGWACTQVFEGHSHYVMQVVFNPKVLRGGTAGVGYCGGTAGCVIGGGACRRRACRRRGCWLLPHSGPLGASCAAAAACQLRALSRLRPANNTCCCTSAPTPAPRPRRTPTPLRLRLWTARSRCGRWAAPPPTSRWRGTRRASTR